MTSTTSLALIIDIDRKTGVPMTKGQALHWVSSCLNCNTNHAEVRVRPAAGQMVGRISLQTCYQLWDIFSDVPVNAKDEIEHRFLNFRAGTPREEIWRWFEQQNGDFVVGEVQRGIRKPEA